MYPLLGGVRRKGRGVAPKLNQKLILPSALLALYKGERASLFDICQHLSRYSVYALSHLPQHIVERFF